VQIIENAIRAYIEGKDKENSIKSTRNHTSNSKVQRELTSLAISESRISGGVEKDQVLFGECFAASVLCI
jgi:hypothetical protein